MSKSIFKTASFSAITTHHPSMPTPPTTGYLQWGAAVHWWKTCCVPNELKSPKTAFFKFFSICFLTLPLSTWYFHFSIFCKIYSEKIFFTTSHILFCKIGWRSECKLYQEQKVVENWMDWIPFCTSLRTWWIFYILDIFTSKVWFTKRIWFNPNSCGQKIWDYVTIFVATSFFSFLNKMKQSFIWIPLFKTYIWLCHESGQC